MVYKILGKRLRITQQSVMKYEAEYQGGEVPLLPVSTVPELYSDFERIGDIDGCMRYMLGNIPHHQGHLTSMALQAVQDGLSWDVVHPTQALTLGRTSHFTTLPESHYLSRARTEFQIIPRSPNTGYRKETHQLEHSWISLDRRPFWRWARMGPRRFTAFLWLPDPF